MIGTCPLVRDRDGWERLTDLGLQPVISFHPPPSSGIDIADSDRSAVRNRITAASLATTLAFAVARFRLVAARGAADRRPTVDTNVDRARSYALTVVLD
jgi:hypothetical protein